MAGEKGHTPEEVAEILKKAESRQQKALKKGVDPSPGDLIEEIKTLGPAALKEAKEALEQALKE